MNYIINISLNGTFYFEIARMACWNKEQVQTLVSSLMNEFTEEDGYKISVRLEKTTREEVQLDLQL